jgi:hypothetical protein
MTALTFNQLKAQVAAVRKKIPETTAIAIRSSSRWTGEAQRSEAGEIYQIYQCDSPLAMRVALREQAALLSRGERATSILITDLDDQQIGDDILVRLKPRKVVPLDNWQIVKSLFQAREIDPRVTKHAWIASVLMDTGLSADYLPSAGGFLDAETVWPILLRQLVGYEATTLDLLTLLGWSTLAENVRRWQSLDPTVRDAMSQWVVAVAGPAAANILACVEANERPDALAIGLAAGVILHPQAKGKLEKASGKFEERFLASQTLADSVVMAWHAAATESVRTGLGDGRLKKQLLARADEILREVGGDTHAWLSDTSTIGFDQRLAQFGDELGRVVDRPDAGNLIALQEARDRVMAHDAALREPRRMERVRMAMRLVRWLIDPQTIAETKPRSLAEAAQRHLHEGSFVDWARLTLRNGEPVRELSVAYKKLFDHVTNRCEDRSKLFGDLLRDWTKTQVTDALMVPVEQVLDRIVAPLASHAPLLVIVIDGMSVAVFRELMSDLLGNDWTLLAEEGVGLRPGLATIPSVTEVSRTSLLCGKLAQGSSQNEKTGFAQHAGLVATCRSTHPPILFHKALLQESEDAGLAADIRKEIGSTHRKVVGVVVNAVDDHLLKGDQIDTRWTRDEIKVLPVLLHEAKMSRRTVILLSDHGHVLDCNAQVQAYENETDAGQSVEGGERWRADGSNLTPQEMRLTGPRVMLSESKALIAPWSERIRYGMKKHGYHGGITPQEMVVPIAVLSNHDALPKGWTEAPVDLPSWWEESLGGVDEVPQPAPVLKPQEPKKIETLFDWVDEAADTLAVATPAVTGASDSPEVTQVAAWIAALMRSPVFEEQKKLGGRVVPQDEVFVSLLSALDARGGKVRSAALARILNCSTMRLRSVLAVVIRVLNIDGYDVLKRDDASDTIELDRNLLCRQFDLLEDPS